MTAEGAPKLPRLVNSAAIPLARALVTWRLIALVDLVRRSATRAFCRATGLSDDEWLAVRQTGVYGPITLTQLAALLSQDKAQASRTLKRLIATQLVSREHLRGTIELTARGRRTFARIVRLSNRRNAALTRDLTDAQLTRLPSLLARLQVNARALLTGKQDTLGESQQLRQARIATALTDREDIRRRQVDVEPRKRLVLPDVINLINLLRTSAGPAYREIAPLAEFERGVLSQVAEHGSLTLIELVPIMNRDKSQVGRTVKRLVALGLLTTQKIGLGGRHVRLTATEEGLTLSQRIMRLSLARNARLMRTFSEAERRDLLSIIDQLTAAAGRLLAREERRPTR